MLSFTLVVDLDALLIFSKEQNLLLEDNRWHFIQDAQESNSEEGIIFHWGEALSGKSGL